MAFVMAKYWGVLPHVIWRYPFRYFKELRDAMIEANRPYKAPEKSGDFDWDDDAVTGGPA